AFEKIWRRALHDGVLNHPAFAKAPVTGGVDFARVAEEVGRMQLAAAPTAQSLDVVFAASQTYDGRFANNGWLQELPQPGTRVVWDNPALVSPATAAALGVLPDKYSERDPSQMYTRQYPS